MVIGARQRFDALRIGVLSHRNLAAPLAIHLYRQGDHILDQQRRISLRPGRLANQSLAAQPGPDFLGQMRHERSQELGEQARRLGPRGHHGR